MAQHHRSEHSIADELQPVNRLRGSISGQFCDIRPSPRPPSHREGGDPEERGEVTRGHPWNPVRGWPPLHPAYQEGESPALYPALREGESPALHPALREGESPALHPAWLAPKSLIPGPWAGTPPASSGAGRMAPCSTGRGEPSLQPAATALSCRREGHRATIGYPEGPAKVN